MKRCVSVERAEQLREVLGRDPLPDRLYLPLAAYIAACGERGPDARPADETERRQAAAWREAARCLAESGAAAEIFCALPFILREERGGHGVEDLERVLFADTEKPGGESPIFRGLPAPAGVLARNIEELAFLKEKGYAGIVEADQTVPFWNAAALAAAGELFDEWTISPELSVHEIRELLSAADARERTQERPKTDRTGGSLRMRAGIVVYGRVSMMVSAGCVRKNTGRCAGAGRREVWNEQLPDRKGRLLQVAGDCRNCYNVIRNAVPTSLMKYRGEIEALGIGRIRFDLTTETGGLAAETTAGRFHGGVE